MVYEMKKKHVPLELTIVLNRMQGAKGAIYDIWERAEHLVHLQDSFIDKKTQNIAASSWEHF